MLKAIYKGDLNYKECPIFQLNENNNKFEMLVDKTFAYDKDLVLEDDNFLVFKKLKDDSWEEINKNN